MDDPPNFNTFNIVLASFALVIVCRVFMRDKKYFLSTGEKHLLF